MCGLPLRVALLPSAREILFHSSCFFEAENFAQISPLSATLFQVNPALTALNLAASNIGVEGAKSIARALSFAGSTRIARLNLSGNRFGSAGATTLARALTANAHLTELVLRGNPIGAEGAAALSAALCSGGSGERANSTLAVLDLTACALGDGGCEHLADALATNPTLQTLLLADNRIGDVGARALSEALTRNTVSPQRALQLGRGAAELARGLSYLDLANNGIGLDGM